MSLERINLNVSVKRVVSKKIKKEKGGGQRDTNNQFYSLPPLDGRENHPAKNTATRQRSRISSINTFRREDDSLRASNTIRRYFHRG